MSGMRHDSPARLYQRVRIMGALLLFASAVPVRAGAVWQLTFGYDEQGVSLVGAAPVVNPSKRTESSAAAASPLNLAYLLEWLDASGGVLQRTPVTLPLGLRSALGGGAGSPSHQITIPSSGAFVLRVPGPVNPTDPRRVRLTQNWTVDSIGSDLAATVPVAFHASEQTFTLPEYVPLQSLPRALGGPVGGRKVQDTGPDANRLVIVVMGDGFSAADLAAGKFSSQVSRFLNTFFATSPWSAYRDAVNVYQVDLVSNETGTDYEDAAPAGGGTLKDTYLDSQFWSGGVERVLYLDGPGISRAYAAADSVVGVGAWDKILVFVNSAKYGGSGGAVGVSSLHPDSDEIQIHEFGHAFAGLADEYDYGLNSTNCVETTLRNVDCGFHLPNVKWSAWVEPGIPLPTPPTATYASTVGAFEGALYQPHGVYRPMLDCKMRTLGVPFCPVCSEAHVVRLFEHIDLAGGAAPAAATVEVTTNLARVFAVDAISLTGMSYRWLLDGVELAGETSPSIAISNHGELPHRAALQVVATHSTPWVRSQVLQGTHAWDLTFADVPTITVTDLAVLEGDTGSMAAMLTLTLSSPSPQIVSASYATQGGTAMADVDYQSAAGQIVFQPGETTQTVRLSVLGDLQPESDESFVVQLSSPVNAKLPPSPARVTIYDDDQPPSVALSSPAKGDVFLQGQPIPVIVNASEPHGQIARVDIFTNGQVWLSLTNAFPVANWTNAPLGSQSLVAVATDVAGRSGTSAPVSLSVLASSLQRFALVALADAWRFDVTTNDYGTGWTAPGYDDSTWSGPSNGVFFNGNLPIAGPRGTPITLTYNGARIRSAYFRTHFQFPAPPFGAVALIASNLVDDGAVFHLNGKEVGRLRMPGGAVTRTTSALPGVWATNLDVIHLDSGSLVEGDNVLAVELHLASDTSFPGTFGMSLGAVAGYVPVLERLGARGAKERVTHFLAADLGGGRPTLMAVGPTSAQGGSVSVKGDWLFYLPPPGYTNNDSFPFVLGDAAGATAANALVKTRDVPFPSANLRVEAMTDGGIRLVGDGIPGQAYAIEANEDPSLPNWQRLVSLISDDAGNFQYIHHLPAGSPLLSYRVVQP